MINLPFLVLFLVSFYATAQDLQKIRTQYPQAEKSSEITANLENALANIGSESSPILQAYKGAVLTLKAKFAEKRKDKKIFFKEGATLIENAVDNEGSNIEIRYIRMSVQENAPKILGYHKDLENDKDFILKNFDTSKSAVKQVITDFVLRSDNFSVDEKAKFH